MNQNFELHTWSMATGYFGQKLLNEYCEEFYLRDKQVSVKKYIVADDWIKKASLPSRFFETTPNVIGCVKTSYLNANDQKSPCVIFNISKELDILEDYSKSMDPAIYIMQEYLSCIEKYGGLVIIQSASNPWHIGSVFHCDTSLVKPLPWSEEDQTIIYGIVETSKTS
jgi:hypothetical protein